MTSPKIDPVATIRTAVSDLMDTALAHGADRNHVYTATHVINASLGSIAARVGPATDLMAHLESIDSSYEFTIQHSDTDTYTVVVTDRYDGATDFVMRGSIEEVVSVTAAYARTHHPDSD